MNVKKQQFTEAVFYFLIFAFFYIWFSRIHPLVVYDADDWTYLAYVREATPIWGDWNPAKVFPEVLMPFFSTIILHTIVPLIGDYICGFTVGHALIVSAFLTAYAYCFAGLIKRTFSHTKMTAGLICILFVVFHFWVFRTKQWNNTYLFFCEDLNCYYNYLLPALANACLVMGMMNNSRFDSFLQDGNPALKGCFFAVLYFAVFSNLVVSGILAAYAGSQILLYLIKQIKNFRISAFVIQNAVHLLILILWFVSAIFELSGGRAASSSSEGLLTGTKYALIFLARILLDCNSLFWLTVAAIVLLCIVFFLRSRGKDEASRELLPGVVTCIVAGAAITVYSALLCGMVDYNYIYRSEYLFSMFFYGFVLVLLALGYAVKRQPKLLTVLPLVLIFLTSTINTSGKTFEDSLMSDYGASVCADISRDILNQYLEADEAGLAETTIHVPMHVADPVNEDNWPHSIVLMPRVGQALYEQGILSQPIDAVFVADPAVNARHNIPGPNK